MSCVNAGLRPLADRITQERQQINSSAESIFMPLRQIWEVGMTALMHRTDQWESKAHLAVRALAALKELLLLLPTWESIKADITRFWGEAHAVSEGLFNNFLAGMPSSIELHTHRLCPHWAELCCQLLLSVLKSSSYNGALPVLT